MFILCVYQTHDRLTHLPFGWMFYVLYAQAIMIIFRGQQPYVEFGTDTYVWLRVWIRLSTTSVFTVMYAYAWHINAFESLNES
jgi:hypothetical protein